MFIVKPRKELSNDEILKRLYIKMKMLLSNDNYINNLVIDFNTNNMKSIDSNFNNNISKSFETKYLANNLNYAFMGILHYCTLKGASGIYKSRIVDTNNTLIISHDVKFNDKVYRFTEYDGDEVFGHICTVLDEKASKDNCIDFNEIMEFYKEFDPEKPHDKSRIRKQK